MLQSFLHNLRKQRVIGASSALQRLNQGWTAEGEAALQREYKFDNFDEASNFIYRYTQYCQMSNHSPIWFNVYNTVKVTLKNEEFGKISTKEVELAQYLDKIHQIRLVDRESVDALSYEKVIQIAQVDQSIELIRNKQNQTTPLFSENDEALRLTAQ
ncbi:UNKNOWN [Stylonychia lemnae]|uniref:4a-hydroxytetrahydrobiopterin dehydratase n=1 Tax=Stylonychia lemnae TaxID=5949 RepID=A0A077ZVC5_STYLE|nr:UNKNOWN [Stylonychia lemnae]|eukprot:CDW72371.1 UNKNOWN [Stylonychia lemnae]